MSSSSFNLIDTHFHNLEGTTMGYFHEACKQQLCCTGMFPFAEVVTYSQNSIGLHLLAPTKPRGSGHISTYLKFISGTGGSCDFLCFWIQVIFF